MSTAIEEPTAEPDVEPTPERPPLPDLRPRRGGLRRLPVLLGRAVLWGVVLVLAVLGARTLLQAGASGPDAREGLLAAFPQDEARALATRFATDYLRYDEENPGDRVQRLLAYLPGAAGDDLGWDGAGAQDVVVALPAGLDVHSEQAATVLVAAQVDDGRWLHLAVPVEVDDLRRVSVTSTPILVPAPATASPAPPAVPVADEDLSSELVPLLQAFFEAYAIGDAEALAEHATPAVGPGGLGGLVELVEVSQVRVASGGDRRDARAVVRWRDPATGAQLPQLYHLQVVRADGRWHVDRLGAAPGSATKENGS
jgi:hypothetical protein